MYIYVYIHTGLHELAIPLVLIFEHLAAIDAALCHGALCVCVCVCVGVGGWVGGWVGAGVCGCVLFVHMYICSVYTVCIVVLLFCILY
jgi:hypothetical protein